METIRTATIYTVPNKVLDESIAAERIELWQLPKLFWAGSILFAANLIIASSVLISPEMNVDIYGEAVTNAITAGTKASPFDVAESQKARPVRTAVKLRPIVETMPETAVFNDLYLGVTPVSASYRQGASSYVSGDKAYAVAEQQSELSRYTAMPKTSMTLLRTSTTEMTPRRASEPSVLIN